MICEPLQTLCLPREDVRPGLQIDRWAKQHRKEVRHEELNRLNRQKSHREMEMERREEALNTALERNNKGFAILQKMGYKIGEGLGRQGAGIKEPIGVNLKAGRGGLGRDVAQKEMRRQQEVCRKQETKVSLEEYRKRVRSKMEDRQLESDLRKSQCACQQLDAQMGVHCPEDAWFWVQENTKKKKKEEEEGEENEDGNESEDKDDDDDDDEGEEEEKEENDEPNVSIHFESEMFAKIFFISIPFCEGVQYKTISNYSCHAILH
uniref:G patch domain-containing protein 11-like n=1 Tax=Myxine glutinosa TaxID=7769 RepID=UPI00358EA17F